MNTNKFEIWTKRGYNKNDKFKDYAEFLVENVAEIDEGSDKTKIINAISHDLAFGAEAVKTKYLLTGIGIGIAGTVGCAGALVLWDKFKRRKETSQEVSQEELEEMGIKPFYIKRFNFKRL